ncbi:MAG: TatD family deoxyribonuclease [Blastochloris sp.]|nr:TatD family deoxyribonuclease [Blastochloris sp.]
MTSLVDYHVHLDLFQDHVSMLNRCEKKKIEIFTMTTTPLAWKKNCDLTVGFPRVRVGLGLHPQLVTERAHEVELFEKMVSQTYYVGEVGLDAGPRFYKGISLQREVFLRVLKSSAQSGPKIFSIHSIRCAAKVMDCIEDTCGKRHDLGFVFHWFSGSKMEVLRALEMGFYFSVNPMMLKSNSSRSVLRCIPINRLLTETDGPFVDKEPQRKFLPENLGDTIRDLAALYEIPSELLKTQIWKNTMRLESRLGKK